MRTEKRSVTAIDPKQERHYTARAYAVKDAKIKQGEIVSTLSDTKLQHFLALKGADLIQVCACH
jgi:hypothetical protein